MIICGLKLTHDGAVAVVEGGVLRCCIEVEKLSNNERYSSIDDLAIVPQILESEGVNPAAVDLYAVDGWGGYDETALALQPRLEIGANNNLLSTRDGETNLTLEVAQYEERSLADALLAPRSFSGLRMQGRSVDYQGYLHVADHVASAYCTSPFARSGESSYVAIWDGGMYPRLYFFDAQTRKLDNLGPLFLLIGNVYTIFSQHFGAFKVRGNFAKDDLSVAGKVMAYIAKGVVREEILPCFDEVYREKYEHPMGFANVFARAVREALAGKGYSDEDILASFHVYLERLLVEKLAKKVERARRPSRNLCFAGGCALNIKWNSAIRASRVFDHVHVPPFPNDSGSAIGAACSAMLHATGRLWLDWDVYSGPRISNSLPEEPWRASQCDIVALARLLHETGEPVVVLNGRAELGPRALGNRSVLATATSGHMKDELNRIKQREGYRPVSPLCLEDRAREIFDPGTPDPWMLFEHRARPQWVDRIPAVIHLDGTARLQTINPRQNACIAALLTEYEKLSGVPVLCNTSANHHGHGFFPDVRSAADWGGARFIWCDGTLYANTGTPA